MINITITFLFMSIDMCPICKSKNIAYIYKLYDDRYGYPGKFNLYKCCHCGYKFLEQNFSSKDLLVLYSNYYPRINMKLEDYSPLIYNPGFISWLNGEKSVCHTYVPENVRVLDIGCGFGESLGYYKNRGCEVFGVEADENVKKVADKFGFNIKIGLFNSNDYDENFFDYITMNQVLEHIPDLFELFKGAYKILKSGGYLVISTPNSNGWGAKFFRNRWINWHIPYHLHFLSKKSLSILAQKTGFEIENINTITSSNWLHYQWIHLLFFPKECEKSIFWDSMRTEKKLIHKVIFKILSLFHKTKINHIITRFFDILGLGDNYIIILRKP